jgi:hypothetical protein
LRNWSGKPGFRAAGGGPEMRPKRDDAFITENLFIRWKKYKNYGSMSGKGQMA